MSPAEHIRRAIAERDQAAEARWGKDAALAKALVASMEVAAVASVNAMKQRGLDQRALAIAQWAADELVRSLALVERLKDEV